MALWLPTEGEREELRAMRRRLEQVQAHYAAMRERARQQQARLDGQAQELWPLARWHKETRILGGKAVQVDVPRDVEAHHALLAINRARRAMLGLDVPKEIAVKAHLQEERAIIVWEVDPFSIFPDPPPVQPRLVDGTQGAGAGNGANEPEAGNGGAGGDEPGNGAGGGYPEDGD